MNSIERTLGILLLLTGGKLISASSLANRFEVSHRTIYRDIDRLIALGIPVEAERGAEGGYRLAKGYLQPPVALTRNETAALLAALSLVRVMRVMPLAQDLEAAERKLIAALPKNVHALLGDADRIIGIEPVPQDIFHAGTRLEPNADWQRALDAFMLGILENRRVRFQHINPARADAKDHDVEPYAVLFDRDLWYLAGRCVDTDIVKIYRADRVHGIEVSGFRFTPNREFSVRTLLGGAWLGRAMRRWESERTIARIRLSGTQAAKLQADWYYKHAAFTKGPDGSIIISIPDTRRSRILPLVRWLGPCAELLGPPELKQALLDDLDMMTKTHQLSGTQDAVQPQK